MALPDAWNDTKRLAQNAFNDVADSYQNILIHDRLFPNHAIDMAIAQAEYGRETDLQNPEQDVSNTEIDEGIEPGEER